MAHLDSVLSFSHDPNADEQQPTKDRRADDNGNGGSDDDDDDDAGFEFAFAPPLLAGAGREAEHALAPADDLFAHGRILPAYPVFERRPSSLRGQSDDTAALAPPSPDTYCAWAPGSPARGDLPKSASTGEARRFWRLRDLVGGRSRSDGKEKFVFLQPGSGGDSGSRAKTAAAEGKRDDDDKPSSAAPPLQQRQKKQGKKKGTAVTEMDMATAHRLFYGKQHDAGADRRQHSYLPYRTGIVGFFATAHALGRSHHPY